MAEATKRKAILICGRDRSAKLTSFDLGIGATEDCEVYEGAPGTVSFRTFEELAAYVRENEIEIGDNVWCCNAG